MKKRLRVKSDDNQPPSEVENRIEAPDYDPLSLYLKQISYNKLLSAEEEKELGIKIKKCKGDIANLLARIENTFSVTEKTELELRVQDLQKLLWSYKNQMISAIEKYKQQSTNSHINDKEEYDDYDNKRKR